MLQGILAIAGWFTRGGAIASLLTWFGVKFTSKAAILSAQIASISLLFASRAAFLVAVLEVAKLTINSISHFFSMLPTWFYSDSIMSLAFNVLRAYGIIDAFMDAFDLFNTLFVAILAAWVLRFAFYTAKTSSDEFFKIGMLLQA